MVYFTSNIWMDKFDRWRYYMLYSKQTIRK